MGKVSGIDKSAKTLDFVSIWLGSEEEWLYAADIRSQVRDKKGFSGATISRYLDELVKKGVLERPKESQLGEYDPKETERKRLFRPTKEYWDRNFQWIPIGSKANDAEYLMLSGIVSGISERFVETSRKAIRVAPVASVVGGIGSKKRNELDAKIVKMLSATRIDITRLARNYYKGGTKEAKYELLRSSILKVVDAYLDLWEFVMTTKGAEEEFSTRMEKLQEMLKAIR